MERTLGDIAVEAFTCLLIFKNIFSFALTWGAYDWLTSAGISKTFYIVASIQVGICLLSVPMCKYLSITIVLQGLQHLVKGRLDQLTAT